MSDKPSVILSGFADEAANQKTAEQQFSAFAALGLQYYTVRFIDAGNGIKNVMDLSKSEIGKLRHVGRRIRTERLVDRFADRQSQAAGCGRWHEEPLCAFQAIPGKEREKGLRNRPRF